MKTIVCLGDSNTCGNRPGGGGRHPSERCWPGVLQRHLGSDWLVVNEGLGGRTASYDDPDEPRRNAQRYLPRLLERYEQIDLLIVMLGTNDLKVAYGATPTSVVRAIDKLITIARRSPHPPSDVLVVSPALIVPTANVANTKTFAGAIEKSQALSALLERCAQFNDAWFFDGASVATSSSVDGIHLDEENHQRLGDSIHRMIVETLGARTSMDAHASRNSTEAL